MHAERASHAHREDAISTLASLRSQRLVALFLGAEFSQQCPEKKTLNTVIAILANEHISVFITH